MPATVSMPDLPAFKVVPPNKDVRVEDFRLSDGTSMIGPDGLLVPAARSFAMIVNTAQRVYSYRFDEAMRDNFVAARAMRRDAFIRGLLEERILPTINRSWSLEVDDDGDEEQVLVRDGLTKVIQSIPDFDAFKRAQLDAVWYGRAGCQWGYTRDEDNDRRWGIKRWDPLHGDSIQFTFDGVPAVLIDTETSGWYSQRGATWGPQGDLRMTDRGGTALVLQRPYWRDRFAIHVHMREKSDFFEGELAGSVQGLGLRGLVYWQYVVRTDALTWMLAYMQAVGQMDLLVFNYPNGNAEAKAQQEANAQKVIGKAAIACPRNPQGNWPAVEQIPMNAAGLKALHELVADYFDRHIERLIVGQSMSAGADKGTGLGGTGRAEFTKATKDEILVYDTGRLDSTFTYDLVAPLKKYNYPWAKFPVRFKSVMPDLEAKEKVMSGKLLISVGVPIKADEFREAAGYSRPEEGDEIVGGSPPLPPGMPPGMPGAPPGAPPGPGGPPVAPPGWIPGPAAGPPGMGPSGPPGPAPQLPPVPPSPTSRYEGAPAPSGGGMGYPGGGNTYIPTFAGGEIPEEERHPRRPNGTPPVSYAGPSKFCSTQIDLTGEAAIRLLQMAMAIPDADLAEDGRETQPHVTVRYGLHDDDPSAAARVIADAGPVRLRLGGVSVFPGSESGKDYDVVKVDVESDDLHALNRALGTLPNTQTFAYHPHATVAYVKAGLGEKYARSFDALDLDYVATSVTFSDRDRNTTTVPTVPDASMPPAVYRRTGGPVAYAHRSFQDMIRDDPHEDTHWLVYADWLDEQGYPRQAARVRWWAGARDAIRSGMDWNAYPDEWGLSRHLPDALMGPPHPPEAHPDGAGPRHARSESGGWSHEYPGWVRDLLGDELARHLHTTYPTGHSQEHVAEHGRHAHQMNALGLLREGDWSQRIYDADRSLKTHADLAGGNQRESLHQWAQSVMGGSPFVRLDRAVTASALPELPPGWRGPDINQAIDGKSRGVLSAIDAFNDYYRQNPPPADDAYPGRNPPRWESPSGPDPQAETPTQAARYGRHTHRAPTGGVAHKNRLFRGGRFVPAEYAETIRHDEQPDSGLPPDGPRGGQDYPQDDTGRPRPEVRDYPQDDRGQRLDPGTVAVARTDPQVARELRSGVTRPDQQDALDALIGDAGRDPAVSGPGERESRDPVVRDVTKKPTTPVAPSQPRHTPVKFDHPTSFAESFASGLSSAPGLDDSERSARYEAAHSLASALPPSVVRRLAKGDRLVGIAPHADVDQVTTTFYALEEADTGRPPRRRETCVGFYDPSTGLIHADGDDPRGVSAHELGHALDQSEGRYEYELSETDEFRMAWSREMRKGQLTEYAATDPAEGFAEFVRLLYGGGLTPEFSRHGDGRSAARQLFPLTYAFFRRHGLV